MCMFIYDEQYSLNYKNKDINILSNVVRVI